MKYFHLVDKGETKGGLGYVIRFHKFGIWFNEWRKGGGGDGGGGGSIWPTMHRRRFVYGFVRQSYGRKDNRCVIAETKRFYLT